jgi:hypothetical protein
MNSLKGKTVFFFKAKSRHMTIINSNLALAGLIQGGIGLFAGMAMSSPIPGGPSVYGVVAAVYSAVVATIFAGALKKAEERQHGQTSRPS